MTQDVEVYKEVQFEAAHRLPNLPPSHKCSRLHGHSFRARIGRAFAHDPGRLELARATLSRAPDGALVVTPLGNQASGAVTSMAQADAFVVIPSEATGVAAGEEVDVILLSDFAC